MNAGGGESLVEDDNGVVQVGQVALEDLHHAHPATQMVPPARAWRSAPRPQQGRIRKVHLLVRQRMAQHNNKPRSLSRKIVLQQSARDHGGGSMSRCLPGGDNVHRALLDKDRLGQVEEGQPPRKDLVSARDVGILRIELVDVLQVHVGGVSAEPRVCVLPLVSSSSVNGSR